MIHLTEDDIFNSKAQVIVNPVNTVGVMGKGLALLFKKRYPEMFRRYREICENGKFEPGQLWIYKSKDYWILHFPTKKHWRKKSKVEYIEEGLKKFCDTYAEKGIKSISFPALGCGNGELSWKQDVWPLFVKYLDPLPLEVFVHVVSPKK